MYMQQSIVKCESGLHNKQATYFIQKANEFKSSIWVEVEERRINAKSLLGVYGDYQGHPGQHHCRRP